MSVAAQHPVLRCDQSLQRHGHDGSDHALASHFFETGSPNAVHPSLARYKPCDLTISCPNRSVSLGLRLASRHAAITPTTPTTDLSEASKVTNISNKDPDTLPPAPCSGPLHPLPEALDTLDRSALEHVARLLYADSVNSRSATTQAWENTKKARDNVKEVERRADLAIAGLQAHAEEKEAQLQDQWAEVESLRSRLAHVSDILSAIFPDTHAVKNQGQVLGDSDADVDADLMSVTSIIRC